MIVSSVFARAKIAYGQDQEHQPPAVATPASPPGTEEAKVDARKHFERGLALFDENALDAALAEFRRSIVLFPTRAAATNAAVTLRRLKRFDEAEGAVRALLRDYQGLSTEDRKYLERQLAELGALVGQLVVRASEQGAIVVLDGVERGTTPLEGPVRVSSGTHVVRVYKAGFVPYEMRVEVAGRASTSLDARLAALAEAGRLAVSEERNGSARVVVDDAVVGVTPWEGTLSPGRHTVALRGDGALGSPPASVVIQANQRTKLSLLVEPLECQVRIEPTPATALVAIDGVEVGRGIWQGSLRCGAHFVEIADDGFIAMHRSIALTKEHAVTLSGQLERDPTSDAFRRKNPSRFTIAANAGLLIGSSLGGPLAEGCKGDCASSTPIGGGARISGGYKLGIGLGFALDAGFLSVSQSFERRASEALVQGLPSQPGTADDALTVRGPTLGAAASYQIGEALVWTARVGAGAFLAGWRDTRKGTFRAAVDGAVPYATPRFAEDGSVTAYYVNPELRVGYPFVKGWTIDAGIQAFFLFGLADARWNDTRDFSAGQCPNDDANVCAGRGRFGQSSVLGSTVLLLSPSIGIRHEL